MWDGAVGARPDIFTLAAGGCGGGVRYPWSPFIPFVCLPMHPAGLRCSCRVCLCVQCEVRTAVLRIPTCRDEHLTRAPRPLWPRLLHVQIADGHSAHSGKGESGDSRRRQRTGRVSNSCALPTRGGRERETRLLSTDAILILPRKARAYGRSARPAGERRYNLHSKCSKCA